MPTLAPNGRLLAGLDPVAKGTRASSRRRGSGYRPRPPPLQAPVALGDVGLAVDGAGEHAAPERRVGDEADAELARSAQGLFALGAIKQRILVLHRGDRMDLVRAADGRGTRLGQSQRPHLADRKSTRLNSSHLVISYAVFCLKKKKKTTT